MIITDRYSNYYNFRFMNRIPVKYILLLVVLLFTAVSVCDLHGQGKTRGRSPERSLFGKSRKVKTTDKKVREPRSVRKAKEEQARKEAKLKKDYNKYVADSKSRAYKIQSPEVQARMKQNEKDIKEREKDHKKKTTHIFIMKDEDGSVYWPVYGVNQIILMKPGEAYQIKTDAG